MTECEILVVGAGPAGLCAAIEAASAGRSVIVCERGFRIGGQLVKQTHMFFGSEKQHASTRGVDIPQLLTKKITELGDKIKIMTETNVLGIYEDGVVTVVERNEYYHKIKPQAIIVATGASEKTLAFENNDLPGVYGAGAVQTLMNVYGVKPGNRVLMVGAGNIGLIVSYQLLQAGIDVAAVIDAAPRIGGYLVHAAKLRRMGVPIICSRTVLKACGNGSIESAVICEVDERFNPVAGTEQTIECDVMCVSVGLTPLTELLSMAGCEMKYIGALGGLVPVRNEDYQTTVHGIFVAGDVSGIEEASAAMVEGSIAGLSAAEYCTPNCTDKDRKAGFVSELTALRAGPAGEHIRKGLEQLFRKEQA